MKAKIRKTEECRSGWLGMKQLVVTLLYVRSEGSNGGMGNFRAKGTKYREDKRRFAPCTSTIPPWFSSLHSTDHRILSSTVCRAILSIIERQTDNSLRNLRNFSFACSLSSQHSRFSGIAHYQCMLLSVSQDCAVSPLSTRFRSGPELLASLYARPSLLSC